MKRPRIDCAGDIIRMLMIISDTNPAQLAKRIKRPVEQLNRLIAGKIALDPRWATELASAFKMPTAQRWLEIEASFKLEQYRAGKRKASP